MTERSNTVTTSSNPQDLQDDPRRYQSPAWLAETEKVASVTALRRAVRRCSKALGPEFHAGLIALMKAELGGPSNG
jgi:hypothetical protein